MGRRAKPLALHLLQGTYRADRHGSNQPLAVTTPDMPAHLDELAQAEWHRLIEEMTQIGTLARLDRGLLASYCCCWSRLVAAEQKINELGLVVKAASGAPVNNPFAAIALRLAKELRSLASELGLSPTSRTRLDIHTPPTTTVMKRTRA
jgi:P27 family predicted phage terminase small subunit